MGRTPDERPLLRGAAWVRTRAMGMETAEAPEFERYGPEFDGRTGNGGLEIWIPIQG